MLKERKYKGGQVGIISKRKQFVFVISIRSRKEIQDAMGTFMVVVINKFPVDKNF